MFPTQTFVKILLEECQKSYRINHCYSRRVKFITIHKYHIISTYCLAKRNVWHHSFSLKEGLPLVTKGEIISPEAHCWSNVYDAFTLKWVSLSNATEQLAFQRYDIIFCYLIEYLNLVKHSGEAVQVQLIRTLGSTYLYTALNLPKQDFIS